MRNLHRFLAVCLPLAACPFFNLAAAEASPPDLSAVVQRLQGQLDEQTKRIDRLYRAIGPHLAEWEESAMAVEKQQQEDKALALARIWESAGAGFTERAQCSPTEPRFAALADDGALRICGMEGNLLQTLQSEAERMTAFAYSSDGTRLLAGTAKGKLLLWDLKTGTARPVGERSYPIDRVAWLANTNRVVVCSARGDAINEPGSGGRGMHNVEGSVLDLDDAKPLWNFTGWQHLDYQNLTAAPNGDWIAIFKILQGRGLYVLDARTGQVCAELLTDAGQGLSVAVSPDSQLVALGNPGIYLWDVKRREIVRHLEGHQNWVVALAFSPDGQRLFSGAGDSTARVWDVKSGAELGRIRFPGASTYVHSVSFSCDGKWVLAAAEGGQLVTAGMPAGRQPAGNAQEQPK